MSMSMYARYLKEKTNDDILERDHGFATYRFINADKVYITDIWIDEEFRRQGAASRLADEVVALAKDRGCKELIGSVVSGNKGSSDSLRVLLAYGMTLHSVVGDIIYFRKDI